MGETGLGTHRKAVNNMMIKRLYRNHTAVVLTIPKPIQKAANVTAGDYVEMEVTDDNQVIRIAKVKGRIENEGKTDNGSGDENQGGQT